MDLPKVTVYVGEDGSLVVDVEGHSGPTVIETALPGRPLAPFGDEDFTSRVRPWAAAG